MSKLALADTSAMYGIVEPRIITPPLRPLTPETSAGFRLCEWAATYISQPLAPHQKLFFQHALEIHPEDPSRYRHRTVLMIGGRQGSFKTSTATIYQLWRLTEDGGQLALITSAQRDNAREAFLRAVKLIQDNPEVLKLVKSIRRANGQEAIDFKNGSRIKILGKPENARGNSADVAWMDELLTHEDYDMFAAIRPTITARPKGQLLATSNAGTVKSIVLNTLRSEAIAGGPGAPFIAEWSSPTGAELSLDPPMKVGSMGPRR